ncbi:B mating type pheromone precursor [Gelatoporia subvermispora B]|uniref:B mating type pheromone n=1 Tax=Ceriporiopsis subvermispora (strain B) TaxID=914234 RepID=M2QDU2_CERS8|nr:B mating type pheromone precursor [Gelatoporia subvermispora B]
MDFFDSFEPLPVSEPTELSPCEHSTSSATDELSIPADFEHDTSSGHFFCVIA